MEEKERYDKVRSGYVCIIIDYKTEKGLTIDEICNLLNKQEKIIKQLGQSQKQLAISELKKLKANLINKVSPIQLNYTDYVKQVYDKINNQIKSLKGEK